MAVNLDAKRDDADKFLADVPARFTVAFDAKGDSAKRFGLKGMPSSYLIGRDGQAGRRAQGLQGRRTARNSRPRIALALGAK